MDKVCAASIHIYYQIENEIELFYYFDPHPIYGGKIWIISIILVI